MIGGKKRGNPIKCVDKLETSTLTQNERNEVVKKKGRNEEREKKRTTHDDKSRFLN